MKRLCLLFLTLGYYVAWSQNINKVEYFIDTDPGYGSATNVPVTASPSIADLSFDVPLSSVSDGFHTLFVRSRDVNNKWSFVYGRTFVKLATLSTALSHIEYFIDADPGYGSGTSVPFTPGASVSDLTFTVPLASLSDGFHTLYIRSRDANNRWSLVMSRPFVKLGTATLPNITRVEYFIDTDPGYGSATAVPISPATSITDLNFSVNVSALAQGPHKLFVRSRDANNKWSLLYTKDFFMCNQPVPAVAAGTAITATGFTANWSAAAGATGYRLDVSADNFLTLVSGYNDKAVTGTSAPVTGLTNGTAYKYRIRATNATCTSLSSAEIPITTLITPPPAPVATAATMVSQSGFTANWNTVANTTGYQLDVSADNFVTFVTGYNAKAVTTNSEIITGLNANTLYRYRVRAVNAGGASVNSAVIVVSTLLSAPVSIAATGISQTGFTANWNAVSGASSYELDISTDDFATFITGYNAKVVTSTSQNVTGLVANTAYQYRVRAVNLNGKSAHSTAIDVSTLQAPAKQNQTITFNAIADKVLGSGTFTLDATASSALAVAYAPASDKITIAASQVTLAKSGRASITASQAGNDLFNAAPDVTRSFCINPSKPTIILSGADTDTPVLTSSSATGNQWFLNDSPITNATSSTVTATQPGIYKVQVKADDCVSEFSTDMPIVITGEIPWDREQVQLYPNPVTNYLEVSGLNDEHESALVIGAGLGKTFSIPLQKEGDVHRADVQTLPGGLYILKVQAGQHWHFIKFIKN